MTRRTGVRLWLGALFGLVAAALAFVVVLLRAENWQAVVLVIVLAVIALALAAPGALTQIRRGIAAWRGGAPPAPPGSGSGAAR